MSKQPNIIYILGDDHRADYLGCSGHPILQTPALDSLARRGVRFFDLRASFADGKWYASHGFLAQPLDECLRELVRFLGETQREFLVVSLYSVEGGYTSELMDWIAGVTEQGSSLLDFMRYDPSEIPLEELRYRDVTRGGSGVVIAPGWQVYGPWHDTNDPEALVRGVAKQNERLKADMGWWGEFFRWTQTQLTAQTGWPELMRAVPDWSLLRMAYRLNYRLLEYLPDWLPQMPVFSVDYADNMNHGFNDRAVEIINAYNRTLS